MRKVLFINIFGGQGGGGEIYLKRLIDGCCGKYEVFLLTPPCNALTFENETDLTINRISGVKKEKTIINLIRFLITILQINIYLFRYKPNTVVINGDRAIYLSPFLLYRRRLLVVKHMLIDSRLKGRLTNFSFKFCDAVITISNFHKKNYFQYISPSNRDKINVIYNAVDTRFFAYTPSSCSDAIKFIQICTLESRKGVMDSLSAFSKLIKEFPQAHFSIVGSGEQQKEIELFIITHDLTNNATMLGHRNDIKELLTEHHILLLPSYDEGLPLSILEAFSVGRPVISTNIAGIPEVIENGVNGYLITPGDIDNLTKNMQKFCDNPLMAEEMGKQARQKIESGFDQKEWYSSWYKIINYN